ncbi:MAG: hypothetical protein HY699_18020 [Deltaproteobacteria bacterium]|nr:hypothetical protein [Deltaproteobacteria bacterium]
MRTPRRLALSAATAWLGAVLAVAVAAEPPGKDRQPPRPPAVAGQLPVRLRSDFPECAHCLVAKGAGLKGVTGTYILDQVRLKHGITQMEPVFGGVPLQPAGKKANDSSLLSCSSLTQVAIGVFALLKPMSFWVAAMLLPCGSSVTSNHTEVPGCPQASPAVMVCAAAGMASKEDSTVSNSPDRARRSRRRVAR